MIPISIDKIIEKRDVEKQRIEYKKGWDIEPIIHSICAFANDYEGYYGGYIIIRVECDENGLPIFPITGLDDKDIDKIERELLEYCKKCIRPSYVPSYDVVEYKNKKLILVWAHGDHDAPYEAKEHIYAKDSKEWIVYIRKGSNTVKATPKEKKEISSYNQFIPFDERANHNASISDIKISLVLEYLDEINSSLAGIASEMTPSQLYESLRIIDGPKEHPQPINAAILFFNEDPSRFVPYSYIEVDYVPDPTGEGMINKTFVGPLHRQLLDALQYIKNNFISSMTRKVDYQAESLINYNYPFAALEEVLTNAVLHKSYQISEPINVRITKKEIIVTSFPGFDYSISDRQIANYNIFTRRYRNRRIGEFLHDFHLAESKNTGFPKAIQSLKKNGSPLLKFMMNEGRDYISVIIPINPLFLSEEDYAATRLEKNGDSLKDMVLDILRRESCTLSELSSALGYKSIPNSLKVVLKKSIESGEIFKVGKKYTIKQ